MPTIPPDIVTNTSSQQLLARMKTHPALAGLSVAEGSMPHQALSPPANEIAEGYVQLERVIELRSLVGDPGHVAWGPYLDEIGDQEMGVPRLSAVPATVAIAIRGTPNAQLPERSRLVAQPNLTFVTRLTITIGADGTGGGLADCTTPGAVGNVPAGAITRLEVAVPGIDGVTNPSGVPLVPGADVESDDDYRTRLLRYRRDPPNGTNAAQYRLWAEEVPGVGRAECVRPMEPVGPQGQQPPPPGSVWVFVTGTELIVPDENGKLAPQAVVDAVQQYIAPALPAVDIPPGSLAPTELPDNGADYISAVPLPTDAMQIAGIWTLRLAMSVAYPNGGPPPPSTPVLTVTVYNVTDDVILDGRPNGQAPQAATRTFTAGELGETPPGHASEAPSLEFFWDGSMVPLQKTIEIRLERSAAQAAAGNGTITLSGVWILSTFADPTHEGLAPVDVRVECYASTAVPIDIAADVQPKPGWTLAAVSAWVEQAMSDYLKGIVYGGTAAPVGGLPNRRANDVLYGMVGSVLYGGCTQADTPLEYYDPATLRVNGGTTDVQVWTGDIATLGTVQLALVPTGAATI